MKWGPCVGFSFCGMWMSRGSKNSSQEDLGPILSTKSKISKGLYTSLGRLWHTSLLFIYAANHL